MGRVISFNGSGDVEVEGPCDDAIHGQWLVNVPNTFGVGKDNFLAVDCAFSKGV
jgi:hypothetical protein